MNRYEIGVIGDGAWGTALAVLAAQAGQHTALWARDAGRAETMRQSRQNPRLDGVVLPETLDVVSSFPDAEVFLIAVPVQHMRAVLTALPESDAALVLCCKGLEAGTLLLPHEVAATLRPAQTIAVLTGPNFAGEIAHGLPAAAVLATPSAIQRARLMAALPGRNLRLYGSADMTGAALGGAAKNVIAIAAGTVMGAGLGENARAALVTRGLAEIARLAAALGGKAETVSGLSGLGDLLLTCTGTSSRNYSLGLALGGNIPLNEILRGRTAVTEGVATAPALLARAVAAGVDMPVTAGVAALLAGTMTLGQAIKGLMQRNLRDE